MNPNIFREYDIRGLVDKDMDDDDIILLGRAMGTYLEQKGVKQITLGRDVRLSSERYRDLLLEGLISTGRRILDIGVCTTPILYFSVFHYNTGGGIMITASHNPPEYNGFKMVVGKSTIYGQEIQKLYWLAQGTSFTRPGGGELMERDVIEAYSDHVAGIIKLERPLTLGVDCGNATGGPVVLPLMERLGITTRPLFCEPDGNFPNHEPDPTVLANLAELSALVKREKLEGGFAYDGDCDRLGVVDENGRPIFGDMLLAIFARSILAREKGGSFIGEVKCSKNLYDDIKNHGGNPIMWKTGHSLMKQKMIETGALLAGEMSGHMFFKHRWFGFDDGIYASLRLAELMSQTGRPLSTWLSDLPPVETTPEIRVDCPDEIKFKVVDRVAELMEDQEVIDVDGVRVDFPDGWGLVRASNTQPALVLRFEARSPARLEEIRGLVENAVARARRELE